MMKGFLFPLFLYLDQPIAPVTEEIGEQVMQVGIGPKQSDFQR
jgi:hypothetical protein